ncbi:hypothetical protein DPMN_010151 [Dreissena polymorpha]|uniref:Uncharacterized protein n=1 Tax=Dreissena polymorpha TaxID=45954 RepID=A0A9D4N1N3_DREPO|nr:hypothetical protein DPMN_010151 [Dreissena polymorpha]
MAAADVKPHEIYKENIKLKRFKDDVVYHLGKVDDIPNTDVVDADNSNTDTQNKKGCNKSVVKTLLSIAVIVVLVVALYVVTDTRHQSTLQSLTSAISSKQGQSGVMLPFAAKQVCVRTTSYRNVKVQNSSKLFPMSITLC